MTYTRTRGKKRAMPEAPAIEITDAMKARASRTFDSAGLKVRRLACGWTRRQAAAALGSLGISGHNAYSLWGHWERGLHSPQAFTLAALAALFGIPIDDLFTKETSG